jgi:hypothetical protein
VRKHKVAGSRRSAKGTEHGFTPVPGGSNGERAREFAKTRGKGKETSAAKRHVTAQSPAKRAKPVHVKPVTKTAPKSDARTNPPTTTPAPTRTAPAPAPKSTPEPAPQTQQPAQTSPAPAPDTGSTLGTTGKTLGTGKQIAATG